MGGVVCSRPWIQFEFRIKANKIIPNIQHKFHHIDENIQTDSNNIGVLQKQMLKPLKNDPKTLHKIPQ